MTRPEKIVQLTDWLPPDFSAVSQYALLIAEQQAAAGAEVTIVGLNVTPPGHSTRRIGLGTISIVPVRRQPFSRKGSWLKRIVWTFVTNTLLIKSAWRHLARCDTIRFTGSPPFMLHFISAANMVLRKKTIYRITDFYPECIVAALGRDNLLLRLFRALTVFLRKRVDLFEVIGNDMKRKLAACGISEERIVLDRDTSPVEIGPQTRPLSVPSTFSGKKSILYSGNWGVAHDVDTFFEGYRRHHEHGTGSVVLWLNATGSGAEQMERKLRSASLPFFRQTLVPLDELPQLLVTPDAHLITLRPAFAGLVLPSKIYGCIASRRPILFIGPADSDVHDLCLDEKSLPYRRVSPGDAAGVCAALEELPWPLDPRGLEDTLPGAQSYFH